MPKSNAPKPINWIAVRAEYEAGGVTMQQLADKLKVSRKTVERHSSKESWRDNVRKVSNEVSAQVAVKVRENVVAQKVEKVLNILSEIDRGIWECIDGMANYEFKSKEGAINGLDKLVRLRLELSDEYIDERLFKRGMCSVAITELSPEYKDNESEKPISSFSDILGESEDISASATTAD